MSHGANVSEQSTGAVPPVSVSASLAVYVGAAPINLGDPTSVKVPVLCSTLAEFEAVFGKVTASSEWGAWTLHEAAEAHFNLYEVGPIVCINVIDPTNAAHYNVVSAEAHILDADGNATLEPYGAPDAYGVIKSTVVVKVASVVKTLGVDYTLAFDDNGFLVVSRVSGGGIAALAHITADYHILNPDGVEIADVMAALPVLNQVYPKLRLVPGFILAPRYSTNAPVAAAMSAIAHSVGGKFRSMALIDIGFGAVDTVAEALAAKIANSMTLPDTVVCWPKVREGADTYMASTHVACIAGLTDAGRAGIPYASPSNKIIAATAAVNDNGDEVLLIDSEANLLNAQGIVTVLNGLNGFRLWGNRTALYPSTTDPKDTFIPIRRMFNWIGNTVILTTERDVDEPGNKRLINGVVDTVQSFLNGLTAADALVAGKIEFRQSENPVLDLADGKIKFHVTLTPPSPAEELDFILEYDPTALAALFA